MIPTLESIAFWLSLIGVLYRLTENARHPRGLPLLAHYGVMTGALSHPVDEKNKPASGPDIVVIGRCRCSLDSNF